MFYQFSHVQQEVFLYCPDTWINSFGNFPNKGYEINFPLTRKTDKVGNTLLYSSFSA